MEIIQKNKLIQFILKQIDKIQKDTCSEKIKDTQKVLNNIGIDVLIVKILSDKNA